MKIGFFVVIFSLSFSSCVSKLSRSNPPEEIHLTSVKTLNITLKTTAQATSGVYWPADEYRYMRSSEYETDKVVKIIEASGILKIKKKKDFDQVYQNVKKDDLVKNEVIWNKDAFDPESNLQFNFYQKTRWGHAYVILPYAVWGIVHVGSLGLIPMWMPESSNYFGDVRSKDGKVLFKFDKECSADVWIWSPFLFTGNWNSPNELRKDFDRECILSILDDAQKAKAF